MLHASTKLSANGLRSLDIEALGPFALRLLEGQAAIFSQLPFVKGDFYRFPSLKNSG
jgi:hypothetical protein